MPVNELFSYPLCDPGSGEHRTGSLLLLPIDDWATDVNGW